MRTYPLIFTFLLLLTPIGYVSADPMSTFGFGPRASAMGHAATASVDDTSAGFHNPAALAALPLAIDVGYVWTQTDLRLNDRDQGVDENRGVQGGVNVPARIRGLPIAFGMSLFLPDERISRIRARPQYEPRFELFDNRTQRVFINSSLAVEPLPWLAIGASVNFLTATRGGLDMRGFLRQDPRDTSLQTAIDVDFGTIRYPTAGVLLKPTDRLKIGLVWRKGIDVVLDLHARVSGAIVIDPLVYPGSFTIDSFNVALFTPTQVVAGAAWQALDRLLVSVDLGLHRWSTYPASSARIHVGMALEGVNTSNLLPPDTTIDPPVFRDVVVPRVGIEWRSVQLMDFTLDLRVGYSYEPTPVPDQPGATNYVDSDHHLATAGLGVHWDGLAAVMPKPLRFDVAVTRHAMAPRVFAKTNAADLVGDFRATGTIWTLQSALGLRF